MKILVLTGSFYPAQEGGPTNAVYWLASGLASCGYDIRVVASSKALPERVVLDEWTELNGFNVIYSSSSTKRDEIAKKEMVNCDCLIRSGVSHIRAHLSNFSFLHTGKKLILSPRGELFYPAIFHKGFLFGACKVAFLKLMGLLYGRRIIYHATSVEEEDQIRRVFGNRCRVFVAPNYMILPERVFTEGKAGYYTDYVYVGRIAPIKALDKLIKALSLSDLFRSTPGRLNILGECKGDYYHHLLSLIDELDLKEKVRFLGVLTGRKKDEQIANARFLFLVSESENFGNVVIEALAQGTPVIASRGTPWSELENRKAGFWCLNSPEQLARIIDSTLQMDEVSYTRLRSNAFAYSRSFDVYSNMEKWKLIIG